MQRRERHDGDHVWQQPRQAIRQGGRAEQWSESGDQYEQANEWTMGFRRQPEAHRGERDQIDMNRRRVIGGDHDRGDVVEDRPRREQDRHETRRESLRADRDAKHDQELHAEERQEEQRSQPFAARVVFDRPRRSV